MTSLAVPVPLAPHLLRSPTRLVLHYLRRWQWQFVTVALLVIGGAACAIGVQYAMKMLVDGMGGETRHFELVALPLGLFLLLIAFENILWRLGGWLGCRTIVGVGVDLRLDLFDHLSGQSMRYFGDHSAGALTSRITSTAGAMGAFLSAMFWRILPAMAELLGAAVILLTVDWRMALTLTLFVSVTVTSLALFGARGWSLHRAYASEAAEVNGELVDIVANIWAVKAFSGRRREYGRLEGKIESEAQAQRRSWMHLEKTRVLHDVCLWIMAAVLLVWVVVLWLRGTASVGDVVVVSALSFRILHGARDLAFAIIATVQDMGVFAENLQILGRQHPIRDACGATALRHHGGRIEFQAVTFAYPGERVVFEDLELVIPPGQKVGLVGSSGAGKSTLVGLVQRFEDVHGGRVLLDGQDVAAVTQDSLHAAIAVVPQETVLFNRSIRENIRYGRPLAADGEVEAAARSARCDEFIRSLPEGYDTMVGERGVKLSGGQRQRLGIARAMLKNAPIIILDEATSALDTQSEIEIQRALAALVEGRTVLAIAHRLSTIASFDRVIVLKDGRIVEDGSPGQLRSSGGIFAALWRLQSEGLFAEDVERAAA